MVDVHILTMGDNRGAWLRECLDSLQSEPVSIHLRPGIPGDTAAARTAAFKAGVNPYVAFVDPDDVIVPGIFAKLVGLLESEPIAVAAYSDETLMDANGDFIGFGWSIDPKPYIMAGYDLRCHEVGGRYIHHLRVMRRSVVERCLPLKTKRMPEPVLMRDLAKLGPILHLAEVGYRWRIHGGNTFLTYTPEEHSEALAC